MRRESGAAHELGHLLFGFQGRINRAKFWLALLIYVVFFFGRDRHRDGGVVVARHAVFVAALIAYVPLIVSGIAVGIKRLHDRNKSAMVAAVFYLAPLLHQRVRHLLSGGDDRHPQSRSSRW